MTETIAQKSREQEMVFAQFLEKKHSILTTLPVIPTYCVYSNIQSSQFYTSLKQAIRRYC